MFAAKRMSKLGLSLVAGLSLALSAGCAEKPGKKKDDKEAKDKKDKKGKKGGKDKKEEKE